MENCILKKYKGEVSNDSLPVFGSFVGKVKGVGVSGNIKIKLKPKSGKTIKITSKGGSYFSDSDTLSSLYATKTIDSESEIYCAKQNFDFEVDDKYNIIRIECSANIEIRLSDILYLSEELYRISIGSPIVDIDENSAFNYPNCTYMALSNSNSTNIQCSAFKDMEYIETLRCNVKGTFNDFPTGTITYFRGSIEKGMEIGPFGRVATTCKTYYFDSIPKLSGTIEDFVSVAIAAGKTTALYSDPILIIHFYVPFGNISLAGLTGNLWITWDSINKIIIYRNTGNNIDNATEVYAKGATSEEIAAWQAAGKTVTDVGTGTVYPPTNS